MAEAPRIELPLKPSVETLQMEIASMKEAVRLLQEGVNRMPTPAIVDGKVDALKELTDSEIAALKELLSAKFEGASTALAAALDTRKEATEEIKSAIGKQFDAVAKRFDDLKERLDRNDGRTAGFGSVGAILVGVGGIVAAIVVLVNFFIARAT